MAKIGIIGCGAVGSTFAHDIYIQNIADIVVVNHNSKKAISNVTDILDCAVDPNHYTIRAGNYFDISDADVVVNCAGDSSLLRSNDREDEYENSCRIANDIIDNLNTVCFHGVFINIMNPCDSITYQFQRLNIPSNQIVGTGTLLETFRLRRIIYELTNRPTDAYIVGCHGMQNMIVCSEPNEFIESNKDKLLQRVRNRVWDIYTGKGFTNFGISYVLQILVRHILLQTEVEELCVSTLVAPAVYKVDQMCAISVPCRLGLAGVIEVAMKQEVQKALDNIFKEGR